MYKPSTPHSHQCSHLMYIIPPTLYFHIIYLCSYLMFKLWNHRYLLQRQSAISLLNINKLCIFTDFEYIIIGGSRHGYNDLSYNNNLNYQLTSVSFMLRNKSLCFLSFTHGPTASLNGIDVEVPDLKIRIQRHHLYPCSLPFINFFFIFFIEVDWRLQ